MTAADYEPCWYCGRGGGHFCDRGQPTGEPYTDGPRHGRYKPKVNLTPEAAAHQARVEKARGTVAVPIVVINPETPDE